MRELQYANLIILGEEGFYPSVGIDSADDAGMFSCLHFASRHSAECYRFRIRNAKSQRSGKLNMVEQWRSQGGGGALSLGHD